jgi:hypothetical protein
MRVLFNSLHRYVYIMYCLMRPVQVPVNWHEVDGSKLIQSKWDIATTSLTMARDMLCVRLCYTLGLWSCSRDTIAVDTMSEKKSQ